MTFSGWRQVEGSFQAGLRYGPESALLHGGEEGGGWGGRRPAQRTGMVAAHTEQRRAPLRIMSRQPTTPLSDSHCCDKVIYGAESTLWLRHPTRLPASKPRAPHHDPARPRHATSRHATVA